MVLGITPVIGIPLPFFSYGGSSLWGFTILLAGFLRITLEAGEEKEFSIGLSPLAFTVVDEEGRRVPGSGSWTVYAGFGAPNPRTEALTGRRALAVQIS